MEHGNVAERGLFLIGCGKMGSAMLAGWLADGLPAGSVWVQDPAPSDWVLAQGVHVNAEPPAKPAVVLIAVKPQKMQDALPSLAGMTGADTLFVSVAAGTTIGALAAALPPGARIVRAMPNTPAAIGRGITAIVGNAAAGDDGLTVAATLLEAVGQVVRLTDEAQMDAVTGVSGSGPAYVFHMIEAMAEAAEAEGLEPDLALALARATVAGAGALAIETDRPPGDLRADVTSPNGTTQAGLDVLMDAREGLRPLMRATVAAAANRARDLGNG